MTLAQDTSILLLDEPTSFLDLRHQLEVLELVRRLNRERNMTIVMALHDLNQASRYADRMVAMRDGAVLADGPTHDLITPDLVRRVFEVESKIVTDPSSGAPICIPYLTDPPLTKDDR